MGTINNNNIMEDEDDPLPPLFVGYKSNKGGIDYVKIINGEEICNKEVTHP